MASLNLNIRLNVDDRTASRQVNEVLREIKKKLANIGIDLEVDDREVKRELNKTAKHAKNAGEDAGKKFGGGFSSTAKKLIGGAAIFAGLAIGAQALKAGTQEAVKFNKELQNVATLGVDNIDQLGSKINQLSKKTADSTSQLTQAAYQTVSAGIQGSQEQLVGFIEQASNAAVAGGATTEDAVNSLTSVLNAYQLNVSETQKVSDTFFGAIKAGKTTFGELDASLSNVIPVASAAGVKFEEVAGNIAQMTANSVPTAQATTQLRQAMIEIQKPGKELADVMAQTSVTIGGVEQTLNASNIGKVLEQQGLTKTLQDIEESASAGGKSLTQVFSSSEAASAALLLTGKNAESANEKLKAVKQGIEDGASTEAFEKAAESIDFQMKKARNNLQAGFNEVFSALLPTINSLLETITPVLGSLLDTIVPVVEQLANAIGPILTNLVKDLQPLLSVLVELIGQQLAVAAENITKILGTLLPPAIKILVPVIETLMEIFQVINPILLEVFDVLAESLVPIFGVLTPIVKIALTLFSALAKTVLPLLATYIKLTSIPLQVLAAVMEPLIPTIERLSDQFTKWMDENLEKILPLIENVVNSTAKLAEGIISLGKAVGLIGEKELSAPFKKSREETEKDIDVKKEAEKGIAGMTDSTKALTGETQALAGANASVGSEMTKNKNLATDYFNALKSQQDEALRMANIEAEINRIREERSKTTADEIVEQERLLDSMLDRRNKLEQSIADGFVTTEDGQKIEITAEERVDLKETLDNLNTDLKFESKNLEKLEVQANIDEKQAKREAQKTIAELRRERIDLEIDLGLRPKTDLIDVYENEISGLNEKIANAEGVRQEELINERLKKERELADIIDELNEQKADKAAQAYERSFENIVTQFALNLSDAFQSIEPNTKRIDAVNEEIDALEERRTQVLRNYRDGVLSAQQYNDELIEIDEKRAEQTKKLQQEQFDFTDQLQRTLADSFSATQDMMLSLVKQHSEALVQQGESVTGTMELALATVGSAVAQTIAEGDATLGDIIVSAIDAAQAVMNAWAAALFVKTNTELPFGLGTVAFAGLLAVANGLLTLAKSAIGGAQEGVFNLTEKNKGKPGPRDKIFMALEEGESVIPRKVSQAHPELIKAMIEGRDPYDIFKKNYLPKVLSEIGISLPGMDAMIMPAALNDKALKRAEQAAERIEKAEAFYEKLENQHLAPAIARDSESKGEMLKQTRILQQTQEQMRSDAKALRNEMKEMKKVFHSKTKVDIIGESRVSGDDLELIYKNKRRKEAF